MTQLPPPGYFAGNLVSLMGLISKHPFRYFWSIFLVSESCWFQDWVSSQSTAGSWDLLRLVALCDIWQYGTQDLDTTGDPGT